MDITRIMYTAPSKSLGQTTCRTMRQEGPPNFETPPSRYPQQSRKLHDPAGTRSESLQSLSGQRPHSRWGKMGRKGFLKPPATSARVYLLAMNWLGATGGRGLLGAIRGVASQYSPVSNCPLPPPPKKRTNPLFRLFCFESVEAGTKGILSPIPLQTASSHCPECTLLPGGVVVQRCLSGWLLRRTSCCWAVLSQAL